LGSVAADVAITNIVSTAVAGSTVVYTVVVTDNGFGSVTGASVVDNFPAQLTGVTYTSTSTGFASDTNPTGANSLNDTVTLTSGSSITYSVTGTLASNAAGSLVDTATVTPPGN